MEKRKGTKNRHWEEEGEDQISTIKRGHSESGGKKRMIVLEEIPQRQTTGMHSKRFRKQMDGRLDIN